MLMYSLSAQEADLALCRCEGGVELALQYAKMWCRYAKDLLAWMEKRISLGEWRRGFFCVCLPVCLLIPICKSYIDINT